MNFVFLFLRKTSLETSLEETCVKQETMLIQTMLSKDPIYGHAPMYLLLPLGKRGWKWGDFHWAMGCA